MDQHCAVPKYTGTIAISFDDEHQSVVQAPNRGPVSAALNATLASHRDGTRNMVRGNVEDDSDDEGIIILDNYKMDQNNTPFQPKQLLPNITDFARLTQNQQDVWETVKAAVLNSQAADLSSIQPRVYRLIAEIVNEVHGHKVEPQHLVWDSSLKSLHDCIDTFILKAQQQEHENTNESAQAPSADDLQAMSNEELEELPIYQSNIIEEPLTVQYLQYISLLSQESQEQLLEDFGMDSLLAFKLSALFSREFSLPQNVLGPHTFVADPTLTGVARFITNFIHKNADILVSDYEKTFNETFDLNKPPQFKQGGTTATTNGDANKNTVVDASTSARAATEHENKNATSYDDQLHTDYDQHDKTTAYVFRGTTAPDRIPYILGIGTAVPPVCAPQEYVIEAMLAPMKMDPKNAERFRKIGEHSGVSCRYSVLEDLGQIFWGKEGVNTGNDEFVDARNKVYKREAIKLAIRSSADAVSDWLGEKVYQTDLDRSVARYRSYDTAQRNHAKYERDREANLEEEKKRKFEEEQKRILEEEKKRNNQDVSSSSENVDVPIKSYANGTEHLVETTTGDSALDKEVAKLGKKIVDKLDRTITHIVAITCTGILVPGAEFHIMQALQLPLTTQRLPITFAGCFGAVSGLRVASSLAMEHPTNRVLVVCTELCTLHMQLNDNIDNLIASALFADGSGAFIVGCAPTQNENPLFSIDSLSSFIIPNTIQQMAWEQSRSGMQIGLAKEIAGEIFNVIGGVVDDMLKYVFDPEYPDHRIRPSQCNLALHPGGPLIINSIQKIMAIPEVPNATQLSYEHPVAEAWKILSEYGNMSSATLVFVLDRMREIPCKFNKPTPAIAFGPGLSVEASLLHLLPGRNNVNLNKAISHQKKVIEQLENKNNNNTTNYNGNHKINFKD